MRIACLFHGGFELLDLDEAGAVGVNVLKKGSELGDLLLGEMLHEYLRCCTLQ